VTAGPADRRTLGRTGLRVSPVCIGTSALGSMPEHYGYEVGQQRAEATIRATLRGPFNFMDTHNIETFSLAQSTCRPPGGGVKS
jgi:D-threo-aldose 1-dehydrogenase